MGGMACCCGVGEAGLNVMNGGGAETNRIYLARADEEGWVVENQVSHDCGAVMLVEYGD